MSSPETIASPAIRRDETVQIALLLAFTGGYLDAYTWIIHGVMANAQTANLVLLWVYGAAGEWSRAAQFFSPIAAFAVGIVIAAWLRRASGDRASSISTLVEILLQVAVGILHKRLPARYFVRCSDASRDLHHVDGAVYSSVMITGNLHQAIEGLFALVSGQRASLRQPGIVATLCAAFGTGAAIVAYATKVIPDLALGLPVVALLLVLFR